MVEQIGSWSLVGRLVHRLFLALATMGLQSCAFAPKSSLQLPPFRIIGKDVALGKKSNPRNRVDLVWPTVPSARMTRGFKHGRNPHDGIDLAAPIGTPIYAAHSGTVLYAGNEFSGYGKVVILESDDGWKSLYSHCHRIHVDEGDRIELGEKIATIGKTGNARGAHLHFELRRGRTPVDPLRYFSQVASN